MSHPHHPVIVGAPRGLARSTQPWLIQRSDDDFIPATLDDLRGASAAGRMNSANGAISRPSRQDLLAPKKRAITLTMISGMKTPTMP